MDDEPEAYYEAVDGSKKPCSLQEAQSWLYQGYFTSSTRFVLRGKDGKEGEWRTLGELIQRNGRAMPFCEWMSNEEDDELMRIREEIIEQNRQKECLKRAIEEIRERVAYMHGELNRIAQKFSDLDSPLELPQAASSTADDRPTTSKIAIAVTSNMWWDVAVGAEKIPEPEPVKRTVKPPDSEREVETEKMPESKPAEREEKTLESEIRTEETPEPEIRKEETPDPGIKTEETTSLEPVVRTQESQLPVARTEISPAPEPTQIIVSDENESVKPPVASHDTMEDEPALPSAVVFSPFTPPPGVDPLALLKSCEGAKRKMPMADVALRFNELRTLLEHCDKATLVQETFGLYPKQRLIKCHFCLIRVYTINSMLSHCCSENHISNVEKMNGSLCADAFDFWWTSVTFQRISTPQVASHDTMEHERLTPPLINTSPFTPPPGVDPLALLNSCIGAVRNIPIAHVARRFKELRALFDRCDMFRLMEETGRLCPKDEHLKCNFCLVHLATTNDMLYHLGSERHIFIVEKMNGSVCADAFDFWWRAIESAKLSNEPPKVIPNPILKPVPVARVVPLTDVPSAAAIELVTYKPPFLPPVAHPHVSPLGVDPFALLNSCARAKRKIASGEITACFERLRLHIDQCNRKLHITLTKELFPGKKGGKRCVLCGKNVSHAEFLAHICSKKHISKMNGDVCADAFDFWSNTVHQATESTIPGKKQKLKPALVVKATPVKPPEPRPLRFTDFDTCATVHKENETTPAPPPPVDPFALLKSCEGARRKMSKSEIETRFKKLQHRFAQCDKHHLVQKMTEDFDKEKFMCALCPVEIDAYSFIPHICGEKHLNEMDGSVCADAFEFWWNVVTKASESEAKPESENNMDPGIRDALDPEPAETRSGQPQVASTSEVNANVEIPSSAHVKENQITQPPGVAPFALLASCHTRFPLMQKETIANRFNELLTRFDRCDKKKLAEQTSSLFEASRLRLSGVKGCVLCKKYVKSVDDMIIHICDSIHIDRMNGDVCRQAFDFWWKAVTAVGPEPDYGKKPVIELQPEIMEKQQPESKKKPEISKKPVAEEKEDKEWLFSPEEFALAVLKDHKKWGNLCCRDPKSELAKLRKLYETCCKTPLDNDAKVKSIFNTGGGQQRALSCLICNQGGRFGVPSSLVEHITGDGHVNKIVNENYAVAQGSIDFWMSTVQRATID